MFDEKKTEQFVSWFLEGLTTYEIADRAKCSQRYVSKVLRKRGINVAAVGEAQRRARVAAKAASRKLVAERDKLSQQARRKERQRLLAESKYALMRELWEKNLTVREIAVQLGKPFGTVAALIHSLRSSYGWFPMRRTART